MFGLPRTTEFNKRIPKQKFYDNLSVSPTLKTAIKDQIKMIYWKNKIAATTMNIAQGDTVTEIEIFEILTSSQAISEDILKQIDKEIPYHILFVLHYEEKYQAWICYKETAKSGSNAFKVGQYYHTAWLTEDEIAIKVDGLDTDTIYENFVFQIAGEALNANVDESLTETIDRAEQRAALQKQIDALQKKIKSEKQLNKQMELNAQLKKLKRELEVL